MVLADLGADVIAVDRPPTLPPTPANARYDVLRRGRRAVALDLKRPEGIDALLRLVATADALVEGFRPGWPSAWGSAPTSAWPATCAWSTAG